MRWSLFAGGKRLRPALVLATGAAFGARAESLTRAACAFELVHTYSLIHDDLPAMDDDDLRRGRPTCHVKFGEATAILAGDALQALAFQVIAEDEHLAAPVRVRLIAELARAAGHPPGWSPVSPTIWPRSRAPMSPPPNSIPSTGTKQARSSWRRRAPGR
jgi:geranylgeranyl pyrophosphate synthase